MEQLKKQEVRTTQVQLEIRDGTDGRTITGYPIVFDKQSVDLGGFVEYVDRDALSKVDTSGVYLIYGHKFNDVLARADAGNLETGIDKNGMWFRATLPNTTLANDVLENIRVGNIRGMSFGFTVADDSWSAGQGGIDVRHIKQIDKLAEITLTPIPAYPDTTVAIAKRDAIHKGLSQRSRMAMQLDLIKVKENIYGNN